MRIAVLVTERLVLRRWKPEDLEPYVEICADREVMRWIECVQAIAAFERAWEDRGFGLFAMELSASGRFIGFVGLSVPSFLPEILPAGEIGWRLAAAQWGQGLATEGARAALAFGFGHVGLDRIVASIKWATTHPAGSWRSWGCASSEKPSTRRVPGRCGSAITRPEWEGC